MTWRCYTIFILLITINTTVVFCQSCDQFIGTSKDNTGAPMFAFKEPIDMRAIRGEQLIVYGCLIDSSLVVILKVLSAGPCVQEGANIHIEFTDGTKLKLKNVFISNCDRQSVLYFAEHLKNLEQLEMLKQRQIAVLKVWTTPPSFVEVEVPEASALKIRESLRCLSNYFDVTPPPDTTSVKPQTKSFPQRDPGDSTRIFMVVEQQPEFEGGYEAMMNFLKKNLRLPASAKRRGIYGIVYVTFIVARDGSIQEAKVLRGLDADLDAEAVRVIKLMPNWKPGRQQGKPVPVRFNLPIKFKPK